MTNVQQTTPVAEARILSEDQARFAAMSQDFNPVHVDPVQARRTQFGQPIVHGVHVLLWAIDRSLAASPRPLPVALRAQFLKPVFVGDTLRVVASEERDGKRRLEVMASGVSVAVVVMAFDAGAGSAPAFLSTQLCTTSATPQVLDIAEMAGRQGRLPLAADAAKVRRAFPAASDALGVNVVAALIAPSRLVGMECPGMHSIFSALSISRVEGADAGADLAWRVSRVDPRIRKVDLDVRGGGIAGRLETFVRMPPMRQPSLIEVGQRVDPRAYAGRQALIVGGSRGLGEIAAKIIAAGGGEPIVTYAAGRDEATRLAEEIRARGGRCRTMRYDVRLPAEPQLAQLDIIPSSFYYFATCAIFRRKGSLYEPELMREFLSFFVDGFAALCSALLARRAETLAGFYPSTVALDAPVRDLAEYSLAKRAGEELCSHLVRFVPELHLIVRRLPRILTDQTATLLHVPSVPPLDVLVPIVGEVERATTAVAA
jgi:acyl dehydratase